MKFRTLLVAALAAASLSASAQDKPKYEFNPYWYLQAQGGAAWSLGEYSSFTKHISPAAAVSVGYRFSRIVGARLNISGWEGRNTYGVYYYAQGPSTPNTNVFKWQYAQAAVDATFDISSIFRGYNPNRVVSLGAFVGAGYVRTLANNAHTVAPSAYPAYQGATLDWDNDQNYLSVRAGLTLDFRVSKHLSLGLEGNAFGTNDRFNSKYGDNPDFQFQLLGGLTYRFGNFDTNEVTPFIAAIPAPAPAPKPAPAPAPAPKPAPAPAPAPKPAAPVVKNNVQNVFFLINSAKVRTSEMSKIEETVAFLNANPNSKVAITGYADKNTGTFEINKRLGQQRVNAVYRELIKRKISANRIIKDSKGDTVQPFSNSEFEKNRCVICIAE